MQVSFLTTAITLLIGSNVVIAGVVDVLAGRQDQPCEYRKKTFGKCVPGNQVYCSGNTDVCTSMGVTDQFDNYATTENERVCIGQSEGATCTQTVWCCSV